MSPNCIQVDRIADVESVPEGHPLRQHVAECPRCQSLWLSYQQFVKADISDVSNIDAARRSLEATIRRQAANAADSPRASRMRIGSAWPAWLRPAVVAAVAALLTVVAVSVWRGGPEEPVLRGDDDAVWVLQPVRTSDASFDFEWKPVEGADAYEVQIFDDDLNAVYRSGVVNTTTFSMPGDALPSVAAGSMLTWRVRALHAGDVVSVSPPSSLTMP